MRIFFFWFGLLTPPSLTYLFGNHYWGFIAFFGIIMFMTVAYEMGSGDVVWKIEDPRSWIGRTTDASSKFGKELRVSMLISIYVAIAVSLIQFFAGRKAPESFFERGYYTTTVRGFIRPVGGAQGEYSSVSVEIAAKMGTPIPSKINWEGDEIKIFDNDEYGLSGEIGIGVPIAITDEEDIETFWILYLQKK